MLCRRQLFGILLFSASGRFDSCRYPAREREGRERVLPSREWPSDFEMG